MTRREGDRPRPNATSHPTDSAAKDPTSGRIRRHRHNQDHGRSDAQPMACSPSVPSAPDDQGATIATPSAWTSGSRATSRTVLRTPGQCQPTGSQSTRSTPDLLATTRNSASHSITWFEAARHTLVVGLSLVVALTGCDDDTSPPSHPSAATATAAVSTPGSIPEGDAAIEPGTYRIPKSAWSVANFTVTFPEGWTVQYGHVYASQSDEADEFGFYAVVVDEIFTEGCAGSSSGLTELGPSVDDLAEALLEQAGPTKSGPADTTLGGYPATRIDLTVPEGFDLEPCNAADIGLQIWYSPPADKNFVLLDDAIASVYILDVDGERQVFVTQHAATTSEEDLAELQTVLDSIRIET